MEGIDPEVAVIRVKLQSFLRRDPGNRRVLMEALNSPFTKRIATVFDALPRTSGTIFPRL